MKESQEQPQPQPPGPVELTPLPTDRPIELSIRSTTRPQAGKTSVNRKVARPLIGARSLVRTPAFNTLKLVIPTNPTSDS